MVLESEAYVGEASSSSDQLASQNPVEQPPQAKFITRPKWDDATWTAISFDYINYDHNIAGASPTVWRGMSKTRMCYWSEAWHAPHFHYYVRSHEIGGR
eukprot:5939686-Karenia_brevis.AAC.1